MSTQGRPRARHGAERGFTVLEALIAMGLITLVALAGLAACKTIAQTMLSSSAASQGTETLENQLTQFRDDAATAFAVFVPAADMTGQPNRGQELDFYAKADDGRAVFWRYLYDAPAQTLQRWDYAPGGPAGVRDVKTGVIDSTATYPPLKHVTRFVADAISADELGDPTQNIYSGVASLFTRTPQAHPVAYNGPGLNVPDAIGGNGVVQVSLANATTARTVHLVAGSLPAGFIVTGALLWHAVVYRVDQTNRFVLGTAQKSHVFINARVDVSYDGWATQKTWCDFNLLGAPDGLDGHDPHADYKPDEPIEQADNILAACRKQQPLPPLRDPAP